MRIVGVVVVGVVVVVDVVVVVVVGVVVVGKEDTVFASLFFSCMQTTHLSISSLKKALLLTLVSG